MKKILIVVALLLSSLAAAQPSTPNFVAEGENVARRLVAFAVREDVTDSDPRVSQARDWLARAAKTTGEEDRAIAAACVRSARFIYDSVRVRVNPLEPLEALASATKPGQTMSDGLMAYVEARRQTPGKTHAEVMAGLAARAK